MDQETKNKMIAKIEEQMAEVRENMHFFAKNYNADESWYLGVLRGMETGIQIIKEQ